MVILYVPHKQISWISSVLSSSHGRSIDTKSLDSIIAVATLQAFTGGKSFYLGKISLGIFTSGFIFPWLKGHTGDHWSLGGFTSKRIEF